ncbi:MAG: excinuclease ABC subunit UvrB [Gemmatimonadetes bacterium]|nr:excinuclease ABC subunit UvrB [Gemmatimonadota bacterium]MYK54609.1 excinuclease ABC subunit UvrB [Gemmatimonadota bacterium]
MPRFEVISPFEPAGDQPQAIEELAQGIRDGESYQTLMGATGTGKTFSMSKVIESVQKPTLVISHNKTLAAQLYGEFRSFFPNNAVEYFISYYDYYQPEAYKPVTDTFIEKEADINDEINRLRLRATSALMERRDVIIVASVSCIYGIGNPDEYEDHLVILDRGAEMDRDAMLRKLVDIHFTRNDVAFEPAAFRVRGDVVEIYPPEREHPVRVEFFGDEIDALSEVHPVTGEVLAERDRIVIYPAKHFVTSGNRIEKAIVQIEVDLAKQLEAFNDQGKLLEAQRLEMRTRYDIEMMREIGFCQGIENYSRYIDGRKPGEAPYVLLDYFSDDFLIVLDESHVTIPQLRGMWNGDRSRKEVLIEHGFRLPAALDNRPLYFEEFEQKATQVVFMSATPADYELEQCQGVVVEQVIRPTGLLDPEMVVRPVRGQVDDLIEESRVRVERGDRVLVTTLTKRMAEDLSEYMRELGIKARYMHSDVDSLERVAIIRDLRLGEFDVLVGVNLLREGLDLPEVSLVAILDADKEGFLRSERSLIQTAGRAARNARGTVIMYADKVTDSMQRAIDETNRRRALQEEYNLIHGITPETLYKTREEILQTTAVADEKADELPLVAEESPEYMDGANRLDIIEELTRKMGEAAENLEFEKAAQYRDEIARLKAEVA